jgi:hypothetical protein
MVSMSSIKSTLHIIAKPPRCGRGRPRKYGDRFTRSRIEALPLQRSAQILYGNPDKGFFRLLFRADSRAEA